MARRVVRRLEEVVGRLKAGEVLRGSLGERYWFDDHGLGETVDIRVVAKLLKEGRIRRTEGGTFAVKRYEWVKEAP
jgi:hypothetical protein